MTNLNTLSGQELRNKIKSIQGQYNLYQISLNEAKALIEKIVDVINERAIEIADKHNRSPYFVKVSQFLNV